MHTAIHTSRKLEKLIKKWVVSQTHNIENAPLGKWNATVFFVDRKKSWLLDSVRRNFFPPYLSDVFFFQRMPLSVVHHQIGSFRKGVRKLQMFARQQ